MILFTFSAVCLHFCFEGRENARIKSEDEQVAKNLQIAKDRARESLESQIDLKEQDIAKEKSKEKRVESYKNQVKSYILGILLSILPNFSFLGQ